MIANIPVYYQLADDTNAFPHIVFTLDSSTKLMNDFNRTDYRLVIDVYFNQESRVAIENVCDDVVDAFDNMIAMLDNTLSRFIFQSYRILLDEDKTIDRRQLEFEVQTHKK